jgi:Cdc6-like AAA superfamily ATPase
MTGTGKTESVNNVIDIIEAENKENKTIPFRSLFINCVNFDTNMKLIKRIYNFIFSRNVQTNKTSNYLNTLDEFFSERNKYNRNIYLNDPTNSHIILIIDEIDYLINKFQIMLYHIFNWSTYSNSKLIIISISNLINIKDLFLSKISSRFGQNKLMFKPYTKEQIREIINYKGINLNLFDEDALKLTSMKVSAINGDLRRVILILKRALELNNNDVFNNLPGGGNNLVNKNYVLKAYRDLFDSKIIFTLKNLNIYEKIIVGAILLNINKFCNNFIKVECIYNDVNILIEKYNKNNINNGKFELDISWNEFKNIIYNLNRMRIIELRKGDFNNFKDNFILIKFYPDEFSVACEYDDDFKPVEIFLTNSLN